MPKKGFVKPFFDISLHYYTFLYIFNIKIKNTHILMQLKNHFICVIL